MKLLTSLKALAGKLTENFIERWTIALIVVGLPAIAYIYGDWRAAIVAFVIPQIIIGYLVIRNTK